MNVNQKAIKKALEQTKREERFPIEPLFTEKETMELQDMMEQLKEEEDSKPKKPSETAKLLRRVAYSTSSFTKSISDKILLWSLRRYALKCAKKFDYHSAQLAKYTTDLEYCQLAETLGCVSIKQFHQRMNNMSERTKKKAESMREYTKPKPTTLDPAVAFTALCSPKSENEKTKLMTVDEAFDFARKTLKPVETGA